MAAMSRRFQVGALQRNKDWEPFLGRIENVRMIDGDFFSEGA